MKPLAIVWLLILAMLPAAAVPTVPAQELEDAWQLISDRNGIQVYMRHREDSRLKTFRGEMRIPLADEYALSSVLNDYHNFPRWLHFVDHAHELDRDGPLQRWLRFTTRLPWPLRDREAVLEVNVRQQVTPDGEIMSVALSGAPDQLPPNRDYVRFPEMEGEFTMQRLGDDEVLVRYQLVLDPGGYIPAWLANILLRDAPYFTLERLRRIVKEPAHQSQYHDYVELRGPGRPARLPPARSYLYGNPPARPLPELSLGQVNPGRP